LLIDVDRDVSILAAKDGDSQKTKQFMLSQGMIGSALEHSIMEQLFSTPTDPTYGVSAVKLIALANDMGMPIYNIDKNNINQIMPLLQLSQEVKTDIQNAVNAGKVVTVSKTNITYNGWTGCGYIITNPNTGAAAYMISGGYAGAEILFIIIGIILLALGIKKGTDKVIAVAVLSITAGILEFIENILKVYFDVELTQKQKEAFYAIFKFSLGVAIGLAAIGIFFGGSEYFIAYALSWLFYSYMLSLCIDYIIDILHINNSMGFFLRKKLWIA